MPDAPAAPAMLPILPRKRRRLFVGLILLVALLLAGGLALPWLLYGFEHARLEREAGPLRLERFARPGMPPGNPAAWWLEAGARVRLAGTELKDVGDAARGGISAIRAKRPQFAVLLERNREALHRVLALEDGPSSLNLDYTLPEPKFPNLFPQLLLARLLYLQGSFALEDGDEAGAAAAAQSLGIQAAILQREPTNLTQRMGLYSEKLQLYLLRGIAQEAPTGRDSGAGRLLLTTDLRSQYRANVTWSAVSFLQGIDKMLAEPDPELQKGSTLEDQVGNAFGRFVERWTGTGLAATAIGRFRLYLQAYDRDYAWMDQELAKDPKEMGTLEKLGNIGCIKDFDLPAIYRATAAARLVIGACLEVRSASLSCQEAGRLTAGQARLQSIRKPDGSCVLRTVDGKDYLRFFKPERGNTIPQDCTVFSAPPESPPRTAPEPADRTPGTAMARSAPAPSK
jgi:hypothetical protein